MSHFSVLIIGADHAKQLQPFHEFECTGTNDEFVQDIDNTNEERADFQTATRKFVRLADGTEIGRYDTPCYREPTQEEHANGLHGSGWGGGIQWTSKDWGDGLGYRPKVWALPEGAEEFEQPHQSFADYLRESHHDNFIVPFGEQPDLHERHKYGYALLDDAGEVVKVVRRTNPNAQWDWWEVGGRWQGKLLLKPGRTGETGRTGLMGSRHPNGGVDQALKGDVDFDKMRDLAGERAGAEYDKIAAIIAGRTWETWKEVAARIGGYNDAAREEYWAQPAMADYKASEHYSPFGSIDDFRCSREEYVQAARDGAIATFAVIKDGQWYQRGEMGWWGAVSDRKDDAEWNREFSALVDGLPDDTPLTVVDCHI